MGVDPSTGSKLQVIMTNEGAADPDRVIKWKFNGFGPYSDLLQAFTPDKHLGFSCVGGLY